MNLTNLTTNLQVEISNYLRKFQVKLKKPEFKFINNGLNGMLRSKSVFISNISLHLHEKIDKKKIEERLLYHLAKEKMFTKLTTSYLEGNSKDIRKQKYIVLDGSAIRKDYAKKMEGLCLVYDGASKKKNKIEIGYHWDNIVGVSRTADGEIHISRCHRIGRIDTRRIQHKRPRDIVAVLEPTDKQRILTNARKLQGRTPAVYVNEQFSADIERRRTILRPILASYQKPGK